MSENRGPAVFGSPVSPSNASMTIGRPSAAHNRPKTLRFGLSQALIAFLIQKREAAGMAQAELAKKLGEYQSFVARLESRQRRVDVVERLALSEILDFDPAKALEIVERRDRL